MSARSLSGIFGVLTFFAPHAIYGQCNPFFPQALSPRNANYEIHVALDDARHQITATQTIQFTNHSPEPIATLRLYLYLNAFKNTETTFLGGTGQIFGQPYTHRTKEEWGWVDISSIQQSDGTELCAQMRFVQPDDGNPNDQSVLEVTLSKPLAAGETGVFKLEWRAQMPPTIARAGYSKDFYLFCHWFPQLGVYEQDRAGKWGWNCHQFFRQTEFYADFGVYDVYITADSKFVMGASGCLISEKESAAGKITRHYHVEDVIDFAWSVYPRFDVQEARWRNVQIRLLIPPEHGPLGPRYLHALQFALEYLDQHVGPYPYPTITVVDPPFHGLRSGLMEYPTLITTGTFYAMPSGIRAMESLVVHEFVHQYFMGMVASNEKEEAWLDEGFVTYFEDRIIDAAYGDKCAFVDFYGYRFDNRELSRLEYTTMRNPREGAVARPGWMFTESNFKSLIYSKTATTLRTVEALLGQQKMDQLIQAYFEKWKFKHPRGEDFMQVLQSELQSLPDAVFAQQIYRLVETSIYDAKVLDYAVTRIENGILPARQGLFGDKPSDFVYENGSGQAASLSWVEIQRKGDWVFPVELVIHFADGTTKNMFWSGEEGMKRFEFEGMPPIVSAQIDPQYKIFLDIDLNNNSLTLQPPSAPLWKYTAKALFWIQNLLQSLSFLS